MSSFLFFSVQFIGFGEARIGLNGVVSERQAKGVQVGDLRRRQMSPTLVNLVHIGMHVGRIDQTRVIEFQHFVQGFEAAVVHVGR